MKKIDKFCNNDCETMFEMGIPLDKGEWLELGYFMRTISNFPGIDDKQKKEIQELLVNAFRNKNFLPEQYIHVIEEIEAIRHFGCLEKLDGLEEIAVLFDSLKYGTGRGQGKYNKRKHRITRIYAA